ncbi:MAG: sensor histidine kinase [Vicinamibacterales bacterium]
MNRLAWELRSPALDDLGLAGALEHFVRRWSSRHGIAAEFRTDDHSERLDRQAETCLFRIAQESLHNVLKHSRATRVAITLGGDHSEVVLTVQDNGVGFTHDGEQPQAQHDGMGLVSMKERATLARGVLEIDATPGRGATILARIPRRPEGDAGS